MLPTIMGSRRLVLLACFFTACIIVHSAPVDPKKPSGEKENHVNSVDNHGEGDVSNLYHLFNL